MSGPSFEAVTGRLGVGAIAMLGLFLLLDGVNHGIFPLIESFGGSATWGMIGVLPTLVVTYIIGVLCLSLAELLLARVPSLASPSPEAVVSVSDTSSALLQGIFAEQLRIHELLKGSSVSFTVLAVGCVGEMSNIGGALSNVWLFATAAMILGVSSLLFAKRAASRAQAIADAARSWTKKPRAASEGAV